MKQEKVHLSVGTCAKCKTKRLGKKYGTQFVCLDCEPFIVELMKNPGTDLDITFAPKQGAAAYAALSKNQIVFTDQFNLERHNPVQTVVHEFLHFLLRDFISLYACYQFDNIAKGACLSEEVVKVL